MEYSSNRWSSDRIIVTPMTSMECRPLYAADQLRVQIQSHGHYEITLSAISLREFNMEEVKNILRNALEELDKVNTSIITTTANTSTPITSTPTTSRVQANMR